MDERPGFVRDALGDRFTMSELCARYGVSRRIGYKLARYDADAASPIAVARRTAARTSPAARWSNAQSSLVSPAEGHIAHVDRHGFSRAIIASEGDAVALLRDVSGI